VEQIVRPTGIVDPPVFVHPMEGAIDHLFEAIRRHAQNDGSVLVITLTKKLAEEVAAFLVRHGVPAAYLHSDLDAFERVEIINKLRKEEIRVIVGVNLLREGLDLPEVSLVAILEADKEGFLRSETSLIQIAGRAARNVNGEVILYADRITDSMRRFMQEAERRRQKQLAYNAKHNITPMSARRRTQLIDPVSGEVSALQVPGIGTLRPEELDALIEETHRRMLEAAQKEEYLTAAKYRDELKALQAQKQKLSLTSSAK